MGLAEGTWLVAVSGGPDSVALLLLLSDLAASRGLSLVVAHVDHGIHPASAEVAARVEQLAARRRLPVVVGRLALGAGATETEARAARYAWLREQARPLGALGILTGHHADDQAETVLMRVLRGSGPAGLAGMSRRAGDLVRPLLSFRREELAQYLLEQGEVAWLDPANADPRHLRSWIRASLLPRVAERLPDVSERLHAVAAQARLERDAWDEVLERLPALRQELAEETARGRLTYAEVEESEADLDRFRTWLAKIAARDYFAAPGGQAAREAVEDAAGELAAFEEAALHADAPEPTAAVNTQQLRIVEKS